MPEWDRCEDRTLYWTLSLHIDRSRLPERFHQQFHPGNKHNVQASYCQSVALRDAVEPLFNDIADRERLSEVGDYLLDVPGPRQGEWIEIGIPDLVEWTTEGTHFVADLGRQDPRLLRCRQFWYVHMNGSLSYHTSFRLKYEHTPADFYFIALLQKIFAPKEFSVETPPGGAAKSVPTGICVNDEATGIFPLDKLRVRPLLAAPDALQSFSPFWHYIAKRFDAHASDLFNAFDIKIKDGRGRSTRELFRTLIASDPFIEVPGLKMPRARVLFLFDDKTFFRHLLPLPADDGRRQTRRDFVKDAYYDCFKEWIQQEQEQAKAAGSQTVRLTREYMQEVQEVAEQQLRYLFLSGFIQNIIDFMNQDASEVLDSTDPVYPSTAEQEEESFFIRYASQRSITQFVPGSRSLKTGNDFIGTCPYVFLVHVLAMHNEFLVRDYERQTEALTLDIEKFNAEARLSRAADRFYKFRTSDYTKYQKHKYANVFRYDTERDLFEAVEARRGTRRKDEYLNSIVTNLEAQTRDLEGRLRSKVDRQFSLLLAAVGVFSVLQVLYQVLDISTRGNEDVSSRPIAMLDFHNLVTTHLLAKYLFLSTSGFLVVTIVLTLWVLRQLIIRR
jgi:hypothetical protein